MEKPMSTNKVTVLQRRITAYTAIWVMLSTLLCANTAIAGATPWTEFSIENGVIMVPTSLAGVEGYSIIDTGAQMTIISSYFVRKHKMTFDGAGSIRVRGVNASTQGEVKRNVPAQVFGVDVTFGEAVVHPLVHGAQMVIGAELLSRMILQIDYPNTRIRAIARGAIDMESLKNVESRRDRSSGSSMVKVRLNDEKNVWLILDTGNANGVYLKRSIATRQGWLNEFAARPAYGRGIIASASIEHFQIPTLAIGPYTVARTSVAVPSEQDPSPMFTQQRGSRVHGLIGYEVLKNFVVTVDYATAAVHLELPKRS